MIFFILITENIPRCAAKTGKKTTFSRN